MTIPPASRRGRAPPPVLARRPALLLALAAASSCARPEPPPPPLPAMGWSHLTPLALDVATVEVAPASPALPPGDIGPLLSPPPAEAVRGMGRDRISASGASGQALFLVTAASLVREPGGALRCSLGCRLEVTGKGGEAGGPGFVEAAAQRGVSGRDAARPRAADLLLRQAMEDLNVEFEFQVRRALRPWLVATAPAGAALAVPVGREELPRAGGEAPPARDAGARDAGARDAGAAATPPSAPPTTGLPPPEPEE